MTRYSRFFVALALAALPLATAHAGPVPNPCGDLPQLLADVVTATQQARTLIQMDNAAHPGVGPGATRSTPGSSPPRAST